jgi:hypothetical protein
MMTAPMPGMMAPAPLHTAKPMIAGVMYILALLIGIWWLTALMAAQSVISGLGGGVYAGAPFGLAAGIITIMEILAALGVIGCLLGAIFCFMRKKFMLALIGGVLALVGLHLLFGLIGFILTVLSKKEFAA